MGKALNKDSLREIANFSGVKLNEDVEKLEAEELVDKLCDLNRWHHWESDSGVRRLDNLVSIIGYRDIRDFLADNPGAMGKIVEFIGDWTARNQEWEAALRKEIADIKGEEQ
jgi:hypothetical protein